tara:strand:+ start:82 stop:309 length:228 start_codon:yes stop_codon:yes gene_type:complete
MEKKKNSPIHGGSNIIPFPTKPKPLPGLQVVAREVEVVVCGLCGSQSFLMLSDETHQIACDECGSLTGSQWRPEN